MALKKSRNDGSGYKEMPQSVLEQLEQEPKFGDSQWFNKRREAYPSKAKTKAAGGVALPFHLLEGKSAEVLPSRVPPESPIMPGGPRSIGREKQRRLKRFSGRKVIAVGDTFIFNGDDRQVYYDTSYPWVCIGQISTTRGRGTAALVGRRIILTASHVLTGLWTPGEPLNSVITFVPAMNGGTSLLGADWTATVTGVAAWDQVSDETVGYDMAICQLDKPMGEWLGNFGCRTYDDDWEDLSVWAHAGYPYDMSPNGDRPCFELGIAVRDDDSDSFDTMEVETDADIASGQSGGPLWGMFNGDPQIIGTLAGHEDLFADNTSNLFAGGNGLVQLVIWGRENWG